MTLIAPSKHQPLHPESHRIVVLIADDDPVIRNFTRLVLEREGYFVLAANDGEEALALSRYFSGTIHVLLTDVQMPRLDGPELRKRLLIERPDTKVIMMSANPSPVVGVPFLEKPLTLTALLNEVRAILGSSEMTAA
jgi:two-component system, cell cycle sensor histidine kinase and response regulator CckA